MRISDWSSDVCSSDLLTGVRASIGARGARIDLEQTRAADAGAAREIDRSAIEDTDITAAITELQKTMTILQATQASRSEEHTSELQYLMRIPYAVFCFTAQIVYLPPLKQQTNK